MSSLTTVYQCPDGTPFPVEWPDEAMRRGGWRWDQMHCPLPVTPLSIAMRDAIHGANRAFDITGGPVFAESFICHGYNYARQVPFDDDPVVRAAVRTRDLDRRMDRLIDLWEHDYRPEVQGITRGLRAFDDPRLSLRQLVESLDQVHALRRRLGELHMLVMGPTQPAMARLIDFCIAEFGAEGEQIAAELTQGFPNKSIESAVALWNLAREARERPAVADLLRAHPPAEVLARLPVTPGGPEFRALLDVFLDEYGHRNESFFELAFPTWREDPRFPLFILRRYLDAPDAAGPPALHEATVRRREARQCEVEGRLAAYPEKLATLRAWLPSAQQRTVLIEDHNYYIDQQSFVAGRVPCLAIGRHLAEQGTIETVEDVFYLTEPELQEAAVKPHLRLGGAVALRRAERDRWLRVLPPATIGEGTVELNDFARRFFGPPQEEPVTDGVISGVAGSVGVMRGTARLVLSLADVDRLAPGEVLVTYATAPPWTPLFAVAGAVVTDAGGMLSHCAVVAREYGIPAVVGTRLATRTIPDGAVVTVDGGSGTVRVEDAAPPAGS